MKLMKQSLALLLALTMLLSLVSCGKKPPVVDIVEDDVVQKVEETVVDKTEDDAVEMAPVAAETDRETLEKIADMVGIDDKEDVSSMDDDTLKDFIYSEIDKEVSDLTPSQDAATGDNPAVDNTGKEEYYEEDGSMNQPFDVIYPELVASGDVEYATDALLLKISNSQGATITSGMKSAGVAKLESVVPMSEYTWYKASLVSGTDISAAVTELRSLSEIAMVDYDYVVETTAMDDYQELPDKLFNKNQRDRWDLHYCGLPSAYVKLKCPGGDSSVIVAVIDTGVDYTHEDLKQNIWVNTAETPDNGIDDDKNGYIDDYYGVDIIDGSGNADDTHGHGTHVAGIIAAQNNNLGIVGLAYNVKVMPVKAANHSGTLLQSNIAKAVYYAAQNGAEVINMSFGGTACSQAVQDALAEAYASCVLVASAGNDGAPNEDFPNYETIPNYPAALSYVVGVMAVDRYGNEASFSNWDVKSFNGVEYEVYAPGVEIVSTIPGNGYASWSGTSMAAPYVSAIAAILRSEYTDRDKYPTKFIYGQICATSDDTVAVSDTNRPATSQMIVNLDDALTKMPVPNLGVSDFSYFDTVGMTQDTAGKNTGDGAVDAGETIALGLTLRNQWGASKNTVVKIDTLSPSGQPDPFVTILNDTVNYGAVGTYATQDCGRIYTDELITGWENPFYIKIADNCPNDYIATLNVTITAENGLDEKDTATYTFDDITVSFVVRNGVVLPSVIEEDMELTPDNLYIIPSGTLIKEGATVTAMPGTHIQFWTSDANDPYASTYIAKLTVAGVFKTEGTDAEPVYIYPSELYSHYIVEMAPTGTGYIQLNGADITNFSLVGDVNHNRYDSGTTAKDCVFRANPGFDNHGNPYYSSKNTSGQTISASTALYGLYSADSCVFYKIPYCYIRASSQLMNCVFVDSGMYFGNKYRSPEDSGNSFSFIQNCLFLGGYYTTPDGKPYQVTDYTLSMNGECIVQNGEIIRWESGDTNYLFLRPTYYFSYDYIDAYLSSLGIYRAVAETEEEFTWLRNHLPDVPFNETDRYTYYDLGIRFDFQAQAYVWPDGTPVASWLQFEKRHLHSWPYLMQAVNSYSNGSIHTADFLDVYNLIYEFPNETDKEETVWSADTIVSLLNDALQDRNALFYGNAILNRLSTETDITKWTRIKAVKEAGTTIEMGGNYWGTTNERTIERQLVDGRTYSDYAVFDYTPYLTTPPELVFPYVTDVTILDKNDEEVSRVGSEEITVRVTFSRDMNMEKPVTVAFGSSDPYRDYVIEGNFVDERTWEGTYTVSTVVGNGYQYFSIGGGEADNGKELYTDWARFAFEIDTTAAQAMIMQGNATAEGITLTWMQDDFDTLMGYNVYRSTALDGQYQRLNSSVIPYGTETFFDDTVEPGKQYFYNFTVVKTDLTESEPSGKITIWSLDTMAPNVYHSVVPSATMGSNLVISATVTDNLQISTVKVMYRTTGTEEYKTAMMNKLNDKYVASIPAADITTAGLEYYIDAFDGINHTYRGSAETPYSVMVLEPTTTSDLGDVDGNGVINLLDALMVLKAKNHKLNLDAAQFARADLDGNDTLETWEALRILQYASGTIGSILGW